jgi:hypothetical protein
MGFRLRQSPSGFNFHRRSTEPSEFSSLPIGRIAKRITQAIGEGPQLGERPPTLRVGYINEFLFQLHSDVDYLQATRPYLGARDKYRQKRDAESSEGLVTHHVAIVHEQRCSAAQDRCSIRA